MDKARLEEIELRLHRVSSDACGGPGADEDMGMDAPFWQHAREDVQELLAEVRQQAALLERFEKDGEQHLLGKEAGRVEAIRWMLRKKAPGCLLAFGAGWWWAHGSEHAHGLPAEVFDLLADGERRTVDGRYGKWPGRCYLTEGEALADLGQAIRRLALRPLA